MAVDDTAGYSINKILKCEGSMVKSCYLLLKSHYLYEKNKNHTSKKCY